MFFLAGWLILIIIIMIVIVILRIVIIMRQIFRLIGSERGAKYSRQWLPLQLPLHCVLA